MSEINLIDQWAFSTDTAFRIPQLMRELKTNLVWSKITHLKDNPFAFIRRILTGSEDEAELAALAKVTNSRNVFPQDYHGPPILFDFTFSSRLQKIFDHQKAGASLNMEEFRSGIDKLLETIKTHPNEWRSVLLALSRNHHLELKLAERLMSFNQDAYESSPLRWLSELYWLYSRCSHFGFAAEELTKVHFHNKAEYSTGSSNVLAYLLRARNSPGHELPLIEGLFRIELSSKAILPALKIESPKQQSVGRFYFLGLGQNEQALAVFPKFFTALYEVFSEFEERKAFHQVFVPVYERDIFTTSDMMPDKLSLAVAGTFLGWLCYDFGDDPPEGIFAGETQSDPKNWCFGGGPAKVSDTFCSDLIHLRFLLNEFAEQYLEGEKEWALQQPMGHASTLEEFVAENVHHFGGWIGETCSSERPPWLTGVFAFNRTTENLPGVDELWIDVTTKPAWESPAEERPVVLKMRKRCDTALPVSERALHDYGVYVSKSVRNFFDRAKLLEIKQALGRSILAEEFAHEIKHAARALSGRWLTSPHSKALLAQRADTILKSGRTLGDVLNTAHLALVPGLFHHVAKVLKLWTAADVEDLPHERAVNKCSPLEDLIALAYDLSASNQLFLATETLELTSITDIDTALQLFAEASGQVRRYEIIRGTSNICFGEECAQSMALDFVRLFVALFTNFRQHGKADSFLRCQLEVQDVGSLFLAITLTNEAKCANGRKNQGTQVIEKLVGRLRGRYFTCQGEPTDFTQRILLSRSNFTIRNIEGTI